MSRDGVELGLYEADHGVLMARRAVQTLVAEFIDAGGEYRIGAVVAPAIEPAAESLAQQPLVETRVCQYENSANGDFLIDRHPAFANVWLVGGGSGHGFKHGPAVGRYAAQLVSGQLAAAEPRFSLASKGTEQRRGVH